MIDRANARMSDSAQSTRWADMTALVLMAHRQHSHARATNLQLWRGFVTAVLATERRRARERVAFLRASVNAAIATRAAGVDGDAAPGDSAGPAAPSQRQLGGSAGRARKIRASRSVRADPAEQVDLVI